MKLPNFLIIGAFKGGNKSLSYYMKQHPEIFMSPVEETRYFSYFNKTINYKGPGDNKFNKNKINTLEKYKNLFKEVTTEKAIGESSSIYFYRKETAQRIKSLIPNVKLIICLKNPAERSFSNYIQKRRNGEEFIKDFNEALHEEQTRKKNNFSPAWFYVEKGFYYNLLKNYYDIFGKKQIKVYLFDDIICNTDFVLKEIFRFLGVNEDFKYDTKTNIDETFLPKSYFLYSILKRRWDIYKYSKNILPSNYRQKLKNYLNRCWNENKLNPELPEETRLKLIEIYRKDILKTQDITGKDLSLWLK